MGSVIGLLVGVGVVLVMLSLTDRSNIRVARSHQVGALTRLVERSGIPRLSAANLMGACVAASTLVGVGTLIVTAVPMVAVMAAAAAGYLPFLLIKRRVSARAKALRVSWPDAVDALVSAVRAGMSLPEAPVIWRGGVRSRCANPSRCLPRSIGLPAHSPQPLTVCRTSWLIRLPTGSSPHFVSPVKLVAQIWARFCAR